MTLLFSFSLSSFTFKMKGMECYSSNRLRVSMAAQCWPGLGLMHALPHTQRMTSFPLGPWTWGTAARQFLRSGPSYLKKVSCPTQARAHSSYCEYIAFSFPLPLFYCQATFLKNHSLIHSPWVTEEYKVKNVSTHSTVWSGLTDPSGLLSCPLL